MRRIMKKVEFSSSSPVIMPPPLFITVLRKTIGTKYWNSHGVRPAVQRIALAPLFHPDYTYDQSLHCQTDNTIQLSEAIRKEPKYVAQRLQACAKAFADNGVPEMTPPLLLRILMETDTKINQLLSKPCSAGSRYFREINGRLEFVRISKELTEGRYGIIKNEPGRPTREAWRQLTPEALTILKSVVAVPDDALAKSFCYVLLKDDSTYSCRPIYESVQWVSLLPFLDEVPA